MLEDVDIDNILISGMGSSGEKNYKYFIDYKDDDYKIKPLHIMLPKASAHLKSYDGGSKGIDFLIKDDDDLLKNITIFRMKPIIVLKMNLIANPSAIKHFWKLK